MRMMRGIVLLLLFTQALAGCDDARSPLAPSPVAQASPQPPAVPLRGTVRDTASNPMAGVLVWAGSGPEASACSNDKGEFTFSGPGVERFVGADVFRADKAGYVSQWRSLAAGLHFVLERVAAPATLE